MSLAISDLCERYGRINTPTNQQINSVIAYFPRFPLLNNNMDAFQYERIFVQVVEEIAAKKGLNGAQLARLAWPHQRAAATAWRKMRNNQKNPKRLNIEEAVLLTQAIGVSMTDVCGIVQGRMMELNLSLNSPRYETTEKKEKSYNSQKLDNGQGNSCNAVKSSLESAFQEIS